MHFWSFFGEKRRRTWTQHTAGTQQILDCPSGISIWGIHLRPAPLPCNLLLLALELCFRSARARLALTRFAKVFFLWLQCSQPRTGSPTNYGSRTRLVQLVHESLAAYSTSHGFLKSMFERSFVGEPNELPDFLIRKRKRWLGIIAMSTEHCDTVRLPKLVHSLTMVEPLANEPNYSFIGSTSPVSWNL